MSTVVHPFSRQARAKVNLRLEVGPLAGSLHRIVSVVAELELADVLRFEPSPSGFSVLTAGAADLAERDNLAWRAAHALGLPLPGVRLLIEKHIPMRAGLGGGSSDAAAALLGLAAIHAENGTAIPHERIALAALQTGSDVPSFLVPGLRIVAGVGDVVMSRAFTMPSWGVVLVRPRAGSSTASAYGLLDAARVPHELGPAAMSAAETMCEALRTSDVNKFISALHNDFTNVVERELPGVTRVRERLERSGAFATILCGSGSCVAGFFENDDRARDAAERLPSADGEWIQVTSLRSG